MWNKLKPRVKQKMVGMCLTLLSIATATFLHECTATLLFLLPLGLYILFTKETYDF